MRIQHAAFVNTNAGNFASVFILSCGECKSDGCTNVQEWAVFTRAILPQKIARPLIKDGPSSCYQIYLNWYKL